MNILKRDLWIGIVVNALVIIMIAYIVFVSFPQGVEAPTGLGLITSLGDAVRYDSIYIAVVFYVFIGLFLMDTWVTAADSLSKLHANMVIGMTKSSGNNNSDATGKAKLFYIAFLIFMLVMTYISSFITQPQQLNYLNGILSTFGSVLLIVGLFFVERYYKKTLSKYPAHPIMFVFLVMAFVAYLGLAIAFLVG